MSKKFTKEQLYALIDRIDQKKLDQTDFVLLVDIISSMKELSQALTDQNTTIQRVEEIFGFKTEQTVDSPLKSDGKNSKLNPPITSDCCEIN